jgi:hypothetical protein
MNEIIGREVSNDRGSIMVSWNKPLFRKLSKAYIKATEAGEESFTMDDLAFDTKYAGYLLLYLADKLGVKNKKNGK